jgi:D-glycero-alpha-D-manno-heptose-7-phosphate kinase
VRDGSGTPNRRATSRSRSIRVPVRIDFAGGWTDVHYFSAREGGAVMNGAIAPCVEGRATWSSRGTRYEYRVPVPAGSGLGTSAAVQVAWLALADATAGRLKSPVQLAEAAYALEKLLGIEGGKQDQYAAALGGFNHLKFGAENEPAEVERLELGATGVGWLEERLILCYTGTARDSGALHERVWAPLLRGDRRVTRALRDIVATVAPARDALVGSDERSLGELLTANREAARALFPGLVTPQMDELFERAEAAGALGSKACGAGGGGCLVFLSRPETRRSVERALVAAGGRLIPFRFVPAMEMSKPGS